MSLFIIGIILIIISLIAVIYAIIRIKHTAAVDQEIQRQNALIERYNSNLKSETFRLETQNELLIQQEKEKLESLNALQESTSNIFEKQKKLSQSAFETYCDILDKDYKEKEEEYNNSLSLLHNSYEKQQFVLINFIEEQKKALEKIKAMRAAAMEAQLREKEIKEQLSFYCLSTSSSDLSDIKVLEDMKSRLSKPRVLNMLIWSTYFQKPMTNLCNNILGTSTITGVYKITNQLNDMCYIGQAVKIGR